jgi:branched-chain amino acid transport system permease protein
VSGSRNAFAVIVLLALPLLTGSDYLLHLLVLCVLFSILALSYNVTLGYIGELSLGHSAFFGIGAYASAIVSVRYGFSFWSGIFLGVTVAAAVGLVIGVATLRIKGPQFAIVTLGLGGIMHLVCSHWVGLTNGPMGITRIPPPTPIGLGELVVSFDTARSFYYLALMFLVVIIAICAVTRQSRLGRAFVSVRENDHLAASVGVDVFTTKLAAFVISTAMAGLGGVLYAHYMRVISPDVFGVHYVVAMLIMVTAGGRGTILGPIVGAVIYVVLLELLRPVGALRLIAFGVILAVCVIKFPDGIVGFLSRRNLLRRMPSRMDRKSAA